MSPLVAEFLNPSVSISVHLLSVQPTTNCVCPPPKSPSKWQCLCPVPTSQVSSKTLSLSLSTLLLSLLPPGWQRGVLLPTTRGAAADTLLLSLGHCRRKEGGQRKWDIQSYKIELIYSFFFFQGGFARAGDIIQKCNTMFHPKYLQS